MKKLGFLTAMFLVACGSSSKQPAQPEPMGDPAMARTAGQESAETENGTDALGDAMGATKPAMPTSDVGDATDEASAKAALPPPPPTAEAHLVSVKDGSAMGHISFEVHDADITMAGAFNGLTPGAHAFYIHTKGDCGKKGTLVGKHLDPTKAKHGAPSASNRHAGDLGDIVADADGNATFQMTTNSVVLEAGRADSILQRAIVIHARKDDKKGSGGAVIACGVIDMVAPAQPTD